MKKLNFSPESFFLVIASIMLPIMVLLMPLNRVPDEIIHADLSLQAIYKDNIDWPIALSPLDPINKEEYKKLFTEKTDLSKQKFKWNLKWSKIQNIPTLLGMLLGKLIYPSVGVIMTMGRLFNAMFFIISMYFIIKYMKYGKYALTFISLLPIMIQQASSLSYDVPNFIAISFFFAVTSDLIVNHQLTKKRFILLFLSIFCLLLTKKNNIFLILILPFLGVVFPEKWKSFNQLLFKIKKHLKKFKVCYILCSIIMIAFFAIIYFNSKGGIIHLTQVLINTLLYPNLNPDLNTSLTIGMFGFIGTFQAQFPLWLIFIDVAVLTIFFLTANITTDSLAMPPYYPEVSAFLFPLHVLIITVGMYFDWTPKVLGDNAIRSSGGQGRYFTPFLIYLSPFFMKLNNSGAIKIEKWKLNSILLITVLLNIFIMIFLLVLTYWYPENQADWLLNIRTSFN